MADDIGVSAEAVLLALRQAYATRLDQLMYENATLRVAVDDLKRRLAEATGGER